MIQKRIPVGSFIIIWCTSISLGLLVYGGKEEVNMNTAGIVSIIVALVGIAGGIWCQIIQFKKDAQRIDSVNSRSANIEKDTTLMVPTLERTDKNVQQIRDKLMTKEEAISTALNGVSELVQAKHTSDAIRQNVSSVIADPAYIQNAISLLYDQNASLSIKNHDLKREVDRLRNQCELLSRENSQLKNELSRGHDDHEDMEIF